jgi:hypothetical protein
VSELERVRLEIRALEAQLVYLKAKEQKLMDRKPSGWTAPD